MDGRRSVSSVAQNEVIHHTGDLLVEGDVFENSTINIKDGGLTILGNVHDGAKITLVADNSLLASHNIVQVVGGMLVGGVSLNSSSFTSCMLSQTIDGVKTMTGNVNINNRIFTNDTVTELGNNKYKVTTGSVDGLSTLNFLFSRSNSLARPNSNGLVTVTVDGVKYSGNEILIDGSKVLVDGKHPGVVNAAPLPEPPKPVVLIIHGNIGNVVTIESDAPIEVKGMIGNFCRIQSQHSGFTAKNIGEETIVDVRDKLTLLKAGKHCTLKSSQYGIDADSLDNNVTVDVRDAINISGDVGHGCTLASKQYGLTARNIGNGVTVTVRDAIKVRNIGSNSTLKSTQYGLSAEGVGNNVTISVRDAIEVNCLGSECKVVSTQYGINISEDVGARTSITVRDAIIATNVGSYCELTSSHNKVKARGNVGNNVIINGRESVSVKDVGDNSQISSSHDEVSVRNVGSQVALSARADINIDGYCAPNAKLNSAKGKVRKAPQPFGPISPKPIRLFPAAAPVPELQPVANDELQIPESYLCVITQELMVRPVICILDGRTYEDKAIRAWFLKHNTCPSNRAEIPAGKTIDDILVINRNLEEAIEEFRQANSNSPGNNAKML